MSRIPTGSDWLRPGLPRFEVCSLFAHRIQTATDAQLFSYRMDTGSSFTGSKLAGEWSWPFPQHSAVIKRCSEVYLSILIRLQGKVKANLSLCLINQGLYHRDIQMEEWGYSSTVLALGTKCRWVVGFMHLPLYPREIVPLHPFVRRLDGPEKQCEPCRVETFFLRLPRNESSSP